jgi:hypothetical protein
MAGIIWWKLSPIKEGPVIDEQENEKKEDDKTGDERPETEPQGHENDQLLNGSVS